MKLIAEDFKLDFAFLPIGNNFTMNAADAAKAAGFINCNTVIGMHYDTFGYIKINRELATKEFRNKGVELRLLNIGETITN
jgi:L-ascorbate metabolism protein UlaG (beta-lactamase superfamily)